MELGVFDGVTPRLNLLTRLVNPTHPERAISAAVWIIDSAEETRIGLGRTFEIKKPIEDG